MPRPQPPRANEERPASGSALTAESAAAAGAAVAGSAAPTAAGVVVDSLAIRETTAAALAGLRAFWGDGGNDILWLGSTLRARHPELTEDEMRELLRLEADYGAEFIRKVEARLERDIPKALVSGDPKAALRKLLEREKRYVQMRQEAMLSRSISTIERASLKRTSPAGAYWRLSPYVKEHTIDCIVMAGKFWPWEVLDVIHPPRHAGCPCSLHGLDEAIGRGLLPVGFVPPDPEEGIALARELQERFKELREAVESPEELAALIEAMESRRLIEAYAPRRYAKGTVKGGEFMPKVGAFSALVKPDVAKTIDAALAVNRRGSRSAIKAKAPSGHVPAKPKVEKVAMATAGSVGIPENFDEFKGRAVGGAAKTAAHYKAKLLVGKLQVNESEPDTTALRRWDGNIELGKDAPGHIELGAAAQNGETDPKAASGTFLAYSRAAHELKHGINPISPAEYKAPEGFALEEALAEELGGQELARQWLAEDGHTDALRWLELNPDHPRALGVYATERGRLGALLDVAGVAPENRAELLRTMGYRQNHQARLLVLGALVAKETGMEPSAAGEYVRATLRGDRDAELGLHVDAEAGLPLFSPEAEVREDGGSAATWEMVQISPLSSPQAPERAPVDKPDPEGKPVKLKAVSGAQGFDARHYSDPRRSLLAKMRAIPPYPEIGELQLADGSVIQRGPKGSFRILRAGESLTPTDENGNKLMPGKLYPTPQRLVNAELAGILSRHGVGGDRLKAARAAVQRAPAEQIGIPDYDESVLGLHDFKAAGGSNGAQSAADKDGNPWLVKAYRGNTDRVATELLANSIYRELGIQVPEAGRLHGELDFSMIPDEPLDEPPLPELPIHSIKPDSEGNGEWSVSKEQSTGMVVVENDGRVWVYEPKGKFGGYENTFSKGRLEGGLTMQQNARKELWEEMGIRANPVGYLGDFEGDSTMTRFYVARRTSDPQEPTGGETAPGGVKLVSPEEAAQMLNRPRDREILAAALAKDWPDGDGADQTPEESKKPKLGYPLVDGETRRWKGESQEFGEGFMADALLGNWDVVGLEQDNVLWDEEGSPIRIDQGGTFEFRAMGGEKPFGPVPTEVWTMRGPKGQANGRMALDDEALKAQAADIGRRLTPTRVDALVAQAPFEDEQMRARVRENLKARVAFMSRVGDGTEELPGPLEGGEAAALLKSDARKLEPLSPEEEMALQDFEGDLGDDLQEVLRSKTKKADTPELAAKAIQSLDGLLDSARVGEDFNAYMPVSIESLGAPDAAELSDKRFRELGYLEASTDRGVAEESEKAVVRLLVPEGAKAFGAGAAGFSTESGAVIFARGTEVRIAGAHEEDGRVVIDAVVS